MRAKALVVIGLAALIPSTILAQSDKQSGGAQSGSSRATASQPASPDAKGDAGKANAVPAGSASPVAPYDPYPEIYGPDMVADIVSPTPAPPPAVASPAPAAAGVTYSRVGAAPNSSAASAGVSFSRAAAAPSSTTSTGVTFSRTATAPNSPAAPLGISYSRTATSPNASPASAGVTFSRTADVANTIKVGVQSRFQKGYIAEGITPDPSVTRDAHGRIQPSAAAKEAFQNEHPCPSKNNRGGSCSGHVITHVRPLECGGADAPSNMQWQTAADAKDNAQVYCR